MHPTNQAASNNPVSTARYQFNPIPFGAKLEKFSIQPPQTDGMNVANTQTHRHTNTDNQLKIRWTFLLCKDLIKYPGEKFPMDSVLSIFVKEKTKFVLIAEIRFIGYSFSYITKGRTVKSFVVNVVLIHLETEIRKFSREIFLCIENYRYQD